MDLWQVYLFILHIEHTKDCSVVMKDFVLLFCTLQDVNKRLWLLAKLNTLFQVLLGSSLNSNHLHVDNEAALLLC